MNSGKASDKHEVNDSGCVWIISDMHLMPNEPHISLAVERFLTCLIEQNHQLTQNTRALYLLGDLFETWIGDDTQDSTAIMLAQKCQALSAKGVEIYLQHGNRDFLIGDHYAASCGGTLLPECHLTDFFGHRTLLLHGDQLCTDDIDYQKIRLHIRAPAWQQTFLAMPPAQRIEQALQYRNQSKHAQSTKTSAIMDVNEHTRLQTMLQYNVSTMIHGHTHRPAIHRYPDQASPAGNFHSSRTVLGAWHEFAYALRVDHRGQQLFQWPLSSDLTKAQLLDKQAWFKRTNNQNDLSKSFDASL